MYRALNISENAKYKPANDLRGGSDGRHRTWKKTADSTRQLLSSSELGKKNAQREKFTGDLCRSVAKGYNEKGEMKEKPHSAS